MEIDAIAALAAAAGAAVSLIGNQSIRAVVCAIFRSPKHDSVGCTDQMVRLKPSTSMTFPNSAGSTLTRTEMRPRE